MPTIAAKVQSLISEQIISGHFKPGTRLDERELAQQFNVSRTPVREALRQLAARGLTQLLPMRGVVVSEISVKDLTEILHANCELEAMCARLAAESMTTMEKTELQYVHERTKEFVAEGNLDKYLDANRELHRLILEGAHNTVISRMVGEIRDRLSPYRQFHPAETDRLATSHDAHKEIVEAIVGGQGEAAYLAMRAHNAHLGNAALRALRQAKEAEGTTAAQEAAEKPARKRAAAAAKTERAPGAPAKRGRPAKATTTATAGAATARKRVTP
ncbi:GntR family transcriptional regulator [Diaphorobacter caeni]|uniref:GntR family transcriptional regulator n=1 Tax=Diaphorobacter caeni TaxID=2784387 RepID=UPI001890507F|nr:GntR family transcriptional regulator [Diaphorobacter caeni]MBF5006759.1 GntR family transcriptional regulator [Diaphorobacter caeni]